MQLLHAQHQARILARSNGVPVAVVSEGRDFMPISLDEADETKRDPCYIAYPSGKTEVIH